MLKLNLIQEKRLLSINATHALMAAVIVLLCMACASVGSTLANYFDGELSPANIFSAGIWDQQDNAPITPLVLSLSAPESFNAPNDEPPADTADAPVVEISDPITTISEDVVSSGDSEPTPLE
jgi:hypothetical protein